MAEKRYQALGLTEADLIEMYSKIILARKLDERLWLLNRAGKVPFLVSCQGKEAAQVGAAFALDREKDYSAPYYRDLGFVLSMGITAKEFMLSAFAKKGDVSSGGRQMPSHFSSRKHRILTCSSVVTTQVPHAVGVALAGRMEGKDLICFTSFGEGSSNQGDFHEGLNFAGVHKLPVIFMCENNGYAISVPVSKQLACKSVADRAIGYGMPGVSVDGNDPLNVYEVVKEAADRARRGEGPTLIEAVTYRLTPHSSDDDDNTYRDKEEVQEARKADPIPRFMSYLIEEGVLTAEQAEEIHKQTDQIVDEATEYAENAPYPDPEDALTHVYAE